jgi:hypothetical protein
MIGIHLVGMLDAFASACTAGTFATEGVTPG